jgi:hypothetical protein
MSEVKVNKISPRSGTDVTLGDSGDTFTVPTGVTLDTSNSTVTLPDGSVTNAKISDSTIELAKLSATGTKDATTFLRGDNTFAEVPAGGITEADQWRITADKTGLGDFTSNWERNDTTGFGYLGTGMSESSGIFTFPSTGIWFIKFNTTTRHTGTDSFSIESQIMTTTNNSTYTTASKGFQNAFQDGATMTTEQNILFDCTSTSTHKVKFNFAASVRSGAEDFLGGTNNNITYATFIRLGDT